MHAEIKSGQAIPGIFLALPVLNEKEALPKLMQCLERQTLRDFRLFVCVNQPDEWWSDPAKVEICRANAETISWLAGLGDPRITLIDRSSPGKGWKGKSHGIGWARKTIIDLILEIASANDIIVSLDADTEFGDTYLESVVENLLLNPVAAALSVPYFHQLTGDLELDRAMLRYEIYMRCYAINLFRIRSPYAFTALGSAIVLPVWSCRAIRGMTPKMSGEDFYFLQKLAKLGTVIHWNRECVFPATRYSSRVYFGTGPALIRGAAGDWSSYPVYPVHRFRLVGETTALFRQLFRQDTATPLDSFLLGKFGDLPWEALRKNNTSTINFEKACHQKLDGLRILQYLKEYRSADRETDEEAMLGLLEVLRAETEVLKGASWSGDVSFPYSGTEVLEHFRQLLFKAEMSYRLAHWTEFSGLIAICN